MEIQKFDIEGPLLISPKIFHDSRGFFTERFNRVKFGDAGLPTDYVQDNYSWSSFKVLRGLHFQNVPPQGKLVSCVAGSIFDVAVDVRKGSKSFGKHIAVTLTGERPQWFWIPAGFAHGFCVTSEEGAGVLYKVTNLWSASGEGSILWNDPDLNIAWPITQPILSDKDKACPRLAEMGKLFG